MIAAQPVGISSSLMNEPKITIFESVKSSAKRENGNSVMTPYRRYKMAKSYADAVAQQTAKQTEVKAEVEKLVRMENSNCLFPAG